MAIASAQTESLRKHGKVNAGNGKNKRSSSLISDLTLDEGFEESEEVDQENIAETGSAAKRMRSEITRLRVENKELLSQQILRETEIRQEVSLEMAG